MLKYGQPIAVALAALFKKGCYRMKKIVGWIAIFLCCVIAAVDLGRMVKGLAFGWDTILIGVLVSALCWKYLLANQSGFLWNLIKSAGLTAVIACALLIVGGEEPGKLPTSSNLVGGHNQDSYSGDYYDIAAEEDSLLSYLPSDPQLVGNKLYINGMFSNSSREYDILDLSGVKIIVADKYGNEQARITLNSQFAKNCVIGPYGTVPYNFTCDASDFTIQSVWDLRFYVEGEYYYTECEGSNCQYCGGPRANNYYPSQTAEPEYSTTKCPACGGSGICQECNGTGRNDASGVLAAWGCTLCDKTGDCYKCGGDGSIRVY